MRRRSIAAGTWSLRGIACPAPCGTTAVGGIYTSNITAGLETGMGRWTSEQFYHAMHDGKGAHGENLYPAFPYPWFRRVNREDVDAIYAYLKTVPAVSYRPPANDL